MAGDLEYLASLNDAQFQATLKRLDHTIAAEQAKADARMQKSYAAVANGAGWQKFARLSRAAFIGVGSAIAIGERSMRSFADSFAPAEAEMRRLDAASRNFANSVGQTLFYADGVGWLTRSVDGMRRAWESATGAVSAFKTAAGAVLDGENVFKAFADTDKELDAYRAEKTENRQDNFRREYQRSINDLVRESDRRRMGAQGDAVGLADLEGRELVHRTAEAVSRRIAEGALLGIGSNDLMADAHKAFDAAGRAHAALVNRAGKHVAVGHIAQGEGLGFYRAVFGGKDARLSGADDKAAKTLAVQTEIAATLKRIEQKSGTPARFN